MSKPFFFFFCVCVLLVRKLRSVHALKSIKRIKIVFYTNRYHIFIIRSALSNPFRSERIAHIVILFVSSSAHDEYFIRLDGGQRNLRVIAVGTSSPARTVENSSIARNVSQTPYTLVCFECVPAANDAGAQLSPKIFVGPSNRNNTRIS